jgi:hypothetical protein
MLRRPDCVLSAWSKLPRLVVARSSGALRASPLTARKTLEFEARTFIGKRLSPDPVIVLR